MSTSRFTLLLFACLIPSFALWTLINPLIVQPAVGLAHQILTWLLPDTVASLTPDANKAILFTYYGELDGKIVSDTVAGYRSGLPQDTRTLSYSFAFFTGLHLASFRLDRLELYGWGIGALYIALVLGLISVSLKDLMLNYGPTLGLFAQNPSQTLIGLSYQFSVLVMPTLAPVALWLWQGGHKTLIAYSTKTTQQDSD